MGFDWSYNLANVFFFLFSLYLLATKRIRARRQKNKSTIVICLARMNSSRTSIAFWTNVNWILARVYQSSIITFS